MDPNRAATATEAQSIRAYINAVTEAHRQQLQDAEHLHTQVTREADDIASQLDAARAAVTRLEEQHQDVLRRLDDATFYRDLAREPLTRDSQFRRRLGLIHPIRRMPVELLREIFTQVVEDVAADPAIVPMQIQPYRLALVCRRWRDIALETKSLWRFIRVCLDDVDVEDRSAYNQHCLYLQLSTDRASNSGIELVVSRRCRNISFSEALGGHLRHIIRQGGTRKLAVKLVLGVSAFRDLFFTGAVPSLEVLHIEDTLPVDFPCLPLASSPNLRKMSLPIVYLLGLSDIQFPSVLDLDILRSPQWPYANVPGAETILINMLHCFPNAKRVAINLTIPPGFVQLLEHRSMQTLHIFSDHGFIPLAAAYNFPQLQEATIVHPPTLAMTDGTCHLMQHAFRTVRRFTLFTTLPMDSNFSGHLIGMPSLEQFSAPKSLVLSEFFERLTTSDPWICPKLKSFILGNATADPGTRDAIINFLTARKAGHERGDPVARVTHFRCDWPPDAPAAFTSRLNALLDSPVPVAEPET